MGELGSAGAPASVRSLPKPSCHGHPPAGLERQTGLTFAIKPPWHPAATPTTPRAGCSTSCCEKNVKGVAPGVEESCGGWCEAPV